MKALSILSISCGIAGVVLATINLTRAMDSNQQDTHCASQIHVEGGNEQETK